MLEKKKRNPLWVAGVSAVLLAAALVLTAQDRPKPEQIIVHAKLEVAVPDFPA
jgi:hypothetical protein